MFYHYCLRFYFASQWPIIKSASFGLLLLNAS